MQCVVDPDPVGSASLCRIRIHPRPADPDPFQPNVDLNYMFCPEQFNILSKVLQIMTPEPLTRKVNNVDWCSSTSEIPNGN